MIRDQKIESLESRVKAIAYQLKRRLPKSVPADELINEGWLGAIDAVDRWDPNRGSALGPFAGNRIFGAMIDYLRRVRPGRRGAGSLPLRPHICSLEAVFNYPADSREFEQAENRLALNSLRQKAVMTGREAQVYDLLLQEKDCGVIARELGVNGSRVTMIKNNVLKRLRTAASGEPAPPRRRRRRVRLLAKSAESGRPE